jgi:hypothetical protein
MSTQRVFALQRAASAELLRELLGPACSEDEFDEAVRKLGAGGSEAADAWQWFQTLMAKLPGEQQSADERFGAVQPKRVRKKGRSAKRKQAALR